MNELGIFNFTPVSRSASSKPKVTNVFFIVLSLNFRASVKAHDCLKIQQILFMAAKLPANEKALSSHVILLLKYRMISKWDKCIILVIPFANSRPSWFRRANPFSTSLSRIKAIGASTAIRSVVRRVIARWPFL